MRAVNQGTLICKDNYFVKGTLGTAGTNTDTLFKMIQLKSNKTFDDTGLIVNLPKAQSVLVEDSVIDYSN